MPSQRSGLPSPMGPSHDPTWIVGLPSSQSSPITTGVASFALHWVVAWPSPSASRAAKVQTCRVASPLPTAQPGGVVARVGQSESLLQVGATTPPSRAASATLPLSPSGRAVDASPASTAGPPPPPAATFVPSPQLASPTIERHNPNTADRFAMNVPPSSVCARVRMTRAPRDRARGVMRAALHPDARCASLRKERRPVYKKSASLMMRIRKVPRWFALVLTAGVGSMCPRGASADLAGAEALFRQGRQLLSEGKTAAACEKFAASQRMDPSSGTLLNLADCHAGEGKTASAWAGFLTAV